MICFRLFALISTLLFSGPFLIGQAVDHWESIVVSDEDWKYKIGSEDIPLDWIEESIVSNQWLLGKGGFGYGDGDDNTLLEDALSVFLFKEFEVSNEDVIQALILHADYDDGFVAYLNGVEIARKNLGVPGERVPYNEPTPNYVEARLFQGLIPEAVQIDADILKKGQNTLAIQVHNHNLSSSDLSSNFYLSVGISGDSFTYQTPPEWFNKSVFESNLPIVKITTAVNEDIVDEPRVKAFMGIIDNGPGVKNTSFDTFNGYEGAISIEYHGTSSLSFDKKSYALETQNQDGSNNNVELLGLPKENDWILQAPYSDKSLLRNVLTYHMGNLTGRYAPKTKLCELFVNNKYEGIYVLTEKIKQDKNRVDISKLTEEDDAGDELTGGYIIKVDRNEQNIPGAGWYSTFPDDKFFAFVEPKDDKIIAAQKEYISRYMFNFESDMASSQFDEVYDDYIDIESLVDYFLVTEIGKHIDAYKLSFYIYKDKDSKGGKINFGPLWDFNFGYGNFNFACSPDPEGWAYEFPDCGSWHPFWARKLIDIPNVQHLSQCRWTELRLGPFQTDSLLRFIDEKVSYMGDAIDRNFERWPVLGEYVYANDFIGRDYNEELDFFKTWLKNRLEWLDNNMIGNCDSFVSTMSETPEVSLKVFPNPASQILNIPFLQDQTLMLEIYSKDMQFVRSIDLLSASNTSIDVSDLSSGVYTMVFRSATHRGTLYVDKLVVLK